MSSFFDHSKPRKHKNLEIEPIKILLRPSWMGRTNFEYESHTIVGLKFKVKTKPGLINNEGTKIDYYQLKVGIYHDTDENKELFKNVMSCYKEISVLQDEINILTGQMDKIDPSTLHERIIQKVGSKEVN